MGNVWVESVDHSLNGALDLLATVVRDCSDEQWEAPMWPVAVPGPEHQFLGEDWKPITQSTERHLLSRRWVERRSSPWSVAWHALEVFDYDLAGEFEPWAPPPPFAGHPHWRDLSSLPTPWSRAEMLGYVEHCRRRQRATMARMTDDAGAVLLPQRHRYNGQPHARIITALIAHTTEHAAQIRQFITAEGLPGDI